MKLINTGCPTVDLIGEMDFTGNVIPKNWFKMVTKKKDTDQEDGKAYLLAICILSSIVYWYRPIEDRDELTDQLIGYRKKFKGELLQKSYEDLAAQFGESKRAVKAAMDRLEELRLIRRKFKNIKFRSGGVATNVMFVDLNVERVRQITFEKKDDRTEKETEGYSSEEYEECSPVAKKKTSGQFVWKLDTEEPASPVNTHVTKNCNIILQKNEGYPTKNCNIMVQKNEGYPTENCSIIPQENVGYPTKNRKTNTKNTKEITTENTAEIKIYSAKDNSYAAGNNPSILSIHQEQSDEEGGMDEMECIREEIRERILYHVFLEDHTSSRMLLDSLIELMTEVLYLRRDIKIDGERVPFALVEKRFLEYNHRTMTYVLECLQGMKTRIKNKRQYLLTTLFNAPATKMAAIKLDIQYDRRWED